MIGNTAMPQQNTYAMAPSNAPGPKQQQNGAPNQQFGAYGGQRQQGGYNGPKKSDMNEGKVFIGGLTHETTKEDLDAYFSQYGAISDSVVMHDAVSQRSRGFGFVTFSDPKCVDELQKSRPHTIKGKAVDTKRALPRNQSAQNADGNVPNKKVYVKQIAPETTDDEVRAYGEVFGAVESVYVNRKTGPNHFGFITFVDYDDADKMSLHPNHEIKGKTVYVSKSLPKPKAQGPMPPMGNNRFNQAPNQFGSPYGSMPQMGAAGQQFTPYGMPNQNGFQMPNAAFGAYYQMPGAQSSNAMQQGAQQQQQNRGYGSYNQSSQQPKQPAYGQTQQTMPQAGGYANYAQQYNPRPAGPK